MKAAVYVRVSSKEQETTNQLTVLLNYAKDRDISVYKIYEEIESAWKNGHQSALAELFEDARSYRFDYVLVWSLDRVSRQGALAVLKFIDFLRRHNIKLISIQEKWTEAPNDLDDILYSIAAWVAKMESQRLSERTKAGQARARIQGKTIGRPAGRSDSKIRRRRTKAEMVASRNLSGSV